MAYLIAAYALVGAALAGYAFWLGRRRHALRREPPSARRPD